MLLEIGLFKKNKNKNKNKTKQKKKRKEKKRNQNGINSGLSQFLFCKTQDVICCSNGYIYHFLDYIRLQLFVNANVIHHVSEHGTFIRENAKGAYREIYKFHTSVISTHFVDQVQIVFFSVHCIVVVNNNKTNKQKTTAIIKLTK